MLYGRARRDTHQFRHFGGNVTGPSIDVVSSAGRWEGVIILGKHPEESTGQTFKGLIGVNYVRTALFVQHTVLLYLLLCSAIISSCRYSLYQAYCISDHIIEPKSLRGIVPKTTEWQLLLVTEPIDVNPLYHNKRYVATSYCKSLL